MRLRCNSGQEQRPIMNTKYLARTVTSWESEKQQGNSVLSTKLQSQCTAPHKLQNNWCTGQPACGNPYTVINIQDCNVCVTMYIIAYFDVNSISCFTTQRDERKNIPVQVQRVVIIFNNIVILDEKGLMNCID